MLNHAGLAVTRLVALVVGKRVVAIEVLRRIHVAAIDAIHVHVLHTIGDHVDVVGARRMGHTLLTTIAVGREESVAVVEVVVQGRGASRGRDHRGGRSGGSSAGTERSSTGLESRLNRGIGGGLLATHSDTFSRQLTVVATREGASRDAAKAGIVVVEVLLSMIVGIDVRIGVDHG